MRPRRWIGASGRARNFTVRSPQESSSALSALVLDAFVVLGVLSWCLAAFLFVRARRNYRGPSGRASLLSPFALWEPANYTAAGALRTRRSLICLILFMACVAIAMVVAQLSDSGKLW